MTEKRDFYEILGVARESGPDDIRRAYRQAALKHHPDRNPGDASAETKFKEATEAYTVLSDADKRAAYDRYGHAGLSNAGFDFSNAGVGDILSHFQDMFSDFFGGFTSGFSGGGNGRHGRDRGQDVLAKTTITLQDVMLGSKHDVTIHGAVSCETCAGSGAKPGTKPETCRQCRGSGQVTAQRGFIMFASTCARCRGTGQTIASPCENCGGNGAVERERKVTVSIPSGIDSGQRLRVPKQGMPGPNGTTPGDLYVDVEIEADERFERHGSDLGTRAKISFVEATLGTTVAVQLPDNRSVSAEIPAGTQPGTVTVLRGQGIPRLDRSGRGDLHVIVDVEVPAKLSKRARKLLEELDEELRSHTARGAKAG